MKLTLSFTIDPADYGKGLDELDGVAIATAIYNGYADPPTTATVQVDGGQWHDLTFGTMTAVEPFKCMTCSGDATHFKDDLSRREYRISGMCQKCQDSVFD